MPVIAHNMMSQFANRQLNITDTQKNKSSEKLSSGYRINRAADDAAGLAISEKLRWQVRGLHRASLNISDGISLCQVADGALHEEHAILQRMRELSIQAANDTNTDADRQAIQWEIEALVEEVDRIAYDTEFNKEIFPLRGDVSSSGTVGSGGATGSGSASSVAPLLDSDYPGSNVQIVDSSTVNNYASYVDSDGKTHYQLGIGTFQIIGLSDAVFEVAGNSCIENTSLKNVTIECAAGTNLSVKNVTVDNSENVYGTWSKVRGTGIGAALKFNGNGNSLNCYGNNEFNGGMDNYKVYTDGWTTDYWSGQDINTYNIACAGINVGNGTELSINGTQNSNLKAHGCFSWERVSHPQAYSAYTASSFGIGSNYHEDGGNIVINSGNIRVYSGIEEGVADGEWCIGGGYGASITINGGIIDAFGGMEACIGGGRTFGIQERGEYADCKLEITINGGIINAQGHNAIGGAGKGPAITGGAVPQIINITGGDITAIGTYVGIGNESPYESAGIINISGGNIYASGGHGAAIGTGNDGYGGEINITGGNITAVAKKPSDAIGTGKDSVPVKVSIDGTLTDASGSDDGNGNNVYTYTGATSGGTGGGGGTGTGTGGSQGTNHNGKENIWIQMGAKSGQGMYLSLVDATAKGIGLTDPPLDVTSFENASDAITRLETAIDKVSTYRGTFGAQQNRLEHAKAIDDNTAENSQAAESRIRDTDMASEMVNHSKHSILQQAGQSMLAQANQSTDGILRLLNLS